MDECKQLEIVFRLGSISAIEALQELLGVAKRLALMTDDERARWGTSSFLTKVEKSGKWSQELKFAGM